MLLHMYIHAHHADILNAGISTCSGSMLPGWDGCGRWRPGYHVPRLNSRLPAGVVCGKLWGSAMPAMRPLILGANGRSACFFCINSINSKLARNNIQEIGWAGCICQKEHARWSGDQVIRCVWRLLMLRPVPIASLPIIIRTKDCMPLTHSIATRLGKKLLGKG